jgi:phage terminase large subunit GpA-like protein
MTIRMLAVDSGYNTQTVYTWAKKHPMNRVIAVKGLDHGGVLVGSPSAVEINDRGRKLKRGGRVWPVSVNIAKSELYGFLRLERASAFVAGMDRWTDSDWTALEQHVAVKRTATSTPAQTSADHFENPIDPRRNRREKPWLPRRERPWLKRDRDK